MKHLLNFIILSFLQVTSGASADILIPAGSPDTIINVVATNYTDAEGAVLQGFLSLPDNFKEGEKKPAVIILHDSSGADTYEQQRVSILSNDWDYVGFAADIFGVDAELPPPDAPWGEGQQLIMSFHDNSTLFVMRIQAAINFVQGLDEVDETKVAIMGYCFGGTGK